MSASAESGGKRRTRGRGISNEVAIDRFVLLVATGSTVRAAAKEVHVSEDTCARWLQEPAIATKVNELRERFYREALDCMRASASSAVETLHEIATDVNAKGADRVKAAIALLDRVGYGPSSKVAHSGTIAIGQMNDEELRAELDRVRGELAKGGGT